MTLWSRIRALSFKQRLTTGFSLVLLCGVVIGAVSIHAMRSVAASQNAVAFGFLSEVVTAKDLITLAQQDVAISRGFLLTRDRLFLDDLKLVETTFTDTLNELKNRPHAEADAVFFQRIDRARASHYRLLNQALAMRKRKVGVAKVSRFFNEQVMHEFDGLERALTSFVKHREELLVKARSESVAAYSRALRLIAFLGFGAFILAAGLAIRLTRNLTQMHEGAQRAVQARDDMLAAVSHDLRNPLTAITMGLRLILRRSSSTKSSEDLRMVTTMASAADRMNRLTQDLLDVAKSTSGEFTVDIADECPHAIAQTVGASMEPPAQTGGIIFETILPEERRLIRCDRERILQVLSNLAMNAIKFTPRGGRITLSVVYDESRAIFSLRDTGTGIPEQDLAHVFSRYWRSKESGRMGGSGLGLSISKSIVETHGGEIWVESEPGQGSCFSFSIPLSRAETPKGLASDPALVRAPDEFVQL